jgi:hypothetical protein
MGKHTHPGTLEASLNPRRGTSTARMLGDWFRASCKPQKAQLRGITGFGGGTEERS